MIVGAFLRLSTMQFLRFLACFLPASWESVLWPLRVRGWGALAVDQDGKAMTFPLLYSVKSP